MIFYIAPVKYLPALYFDFFKSESIPVMMSMIKYNFKIEFITFSLLFHVQ